MDAAVHAGQRRAAGAEGQQAQEEQCEDLLAVQKPSPAFRFLQVLWVSPGAAESLGLPPHS